MTAPVWLTITEASEHCGASVRTLERWIARAHDPLRSVLVLVGGHYIRHISVDDLDSYKRPKMGGKR